MTADDFEEFMNLIETNDWFPERRVISFDGRSARKHPLVLLVMGALFVMGGGRFLDLPDFTHVSEPSHRAFFKRFVEVGSTIMLDMFVVPPKTAEELKAANLPFKMAGLPGCIACADGVRIRGWAISHSLEHLNIGKEGVPVKSFHAVVGFDRIFYSMTKSFFGNTPDSVMARRDPFLKMVRSDPAFTEFEYQTSDTNGEVLQNTGAWVLVDGGYAYEPILQCPSTSAVSVAEQRWSRMLTAIRKVVECTFGMMKKKFAILLKGVSLQTEVDFENLVRTAATIHNFLRKRQIRRLVRLGLNSIHDLADDSDVSDLDDIDEAHVPRANRRSGPYRRCPKRAKLIAHYFFEEAAGRVVWPRMQEQEWVPSDSPDCDLKDLGSDVEVQLDDDDADIDG